MHKVKRETSRKTPITTEATSPSGAPTSAILVSLHQVPTLPRDDGLGEADDTLLHVLV